MNSSDLAPFSSIKSGRTGYSRNVRSWNTQKRSDCFPAPGSQVPPLSSGNRHGKQEEITSPHALRHSIFQSGARQEVPVEGRRAERGNSPGIRESRESLFSRPGRPPACRIHSGNPVRDRLLRSIRSSRRCESDRRNHGSPGIQEDRRTRF